MVINTWPRPNLSLTTATGASLVPNALRRCERCFADRAPRTWSAVACGCSTGECDDKWRAAALPHNIHRGKWGAPPDAACWQHQPQAVSSDDRVVVQYRHATAATTCQGTTVAATSAHTGC